ncbi:hypothetical protein BP1258A_3892 [Burkholderia pseudomallei 1258a]|nr:hypothetical protein BP1258A_3892 [Burkholderia pseudomallei 1258a]EIF59058.1 hypothetical protein BP1258B_4297 [Burkholderia pseudomallei 1258b]
MLACGASSIADCLLSIVDRRLPLRHGVPVRFASRRRAHAIHDIGTAASGRLASHDNAAAAPTPTRFRLDSGSMPARFRRDRTGAGNAHRTRPSASHDPVYGESAGPSNAPFSTPPKHRPAPRFAPRPLPISTEHCVGNRRQAAVPDDAKFVAR